MAENKARKSRFDKGIPTQNLDGADSILDAGKEDIKEKKPILKLKTLDTDLKKKKQISINITVKNIQQVEEMMAETNRDRNEFFRYMIDEFYKITR